MILLGNHKPSRGITVVAVLVCLIIITMVGLAMLKLGRAQHDQVRTFERRLQAEWLAESGMERALARLASDGSYRGEIWSISAARNAVIPESPLRAYRSPARKTRGRDDRKKDSA